MSGSCLAELSGLKPRLEEIQGALDSGRPVRVVGDSGTGRSTLARRLADRPDALLIELPPPGPDAALHGLLQIAGNLDEAALTWALEPGRTLLEKTSTLAERLADQGRIPIVLVPRGWGVRSDESEPFSAQQNEFLQGVQQVPLWVLVTTVRTPGQPDLRLEPAGVRWEAFEDVTVWGELLVHARAVREILASRRMPVSPILARLAVAFLYLGGRRERLAVLNSLEELAREVVGRLARLPEHLQNLPGQLRHLARSRFPIPHESLSKTIRKNPVQRILVTECFGYGETSVKLTRSLIREVLASASSRGREEKSHRRWALQYRKRLEQTKNGAALQYRLERMFHLGHAGLEAEAEWLDELRAWREPVEFIWERARALSVSGKPCEAAALYQICRQKDPARAYSWHYEGFNLDRCGRTFADVYPCLVQAVELDPENPWWNGRLVTFLIRHARFDQARDRFASAMSRIRQRDAWFSKHFLRWVAHQWLESGQPLEAERVFSQIDKLHVEEDRALRVLRQQILDAVEVLHLGDSVYAPNYPVERRWKVPAEIPAQSPNGHPLTSWYPFRVQELSREGPVIVLATTDPARRVLRKTLTPGDWEDWLGEPWTEAAGFYFAGVYADQTAVIRATPPDTMVPHTLSYDAKDGYWRSVD